MKPFWRAVRGRQEGFRKQAGFSNALHAYWRAKMARRSRKSRSDAAGQTTAHARHLSSGRFHFSTFWTGKRSRRWSVRSTGLSRMSGSRSGTTLSRWISGAPKGRSWMVTSSVPRPIGSVRSVQRRRASSRRSRAIPKDRSRSEGTIRSLRQSMARPLSAISKAGGVMVPSRHSTTLSV